jgi:hypothetical protein
VQVLISKFTPSDLDCALGRSMTLEIGCLFKQRPAAAGRLRLSAGRNPRPANSHLHQFRIDILGVQRVRSLAVGLRTHGLGSFPVIQARRGIAAPTTGRKVLLTQPVAGAR